MFHETHRCYFVFKVFSLRPAFEYLDTITAQKSELNSFRFTAPSVLTRMHRTTVTDTWLGWAFAGVSIGHY